MSLTASRFKTWVSMQGTIVIVAGLGLRMTRRKRRREGSGTQSGANLLAPKV
jgi:hypothetical protein